MLIHQWIITEDSIQSPRLWENNLWDFLSLTGRSLQFHQQSLFDTNTGLIIVQRFIDRMLARQMHMYFYSHKSVLDFKRTIRRADYQLAWSRQMRRGFRKTEVNRLQVLPASVWWRVRESGRWDPFHHHILFNIFQCKRCAFNSLCSTAQMLYTWPAEVFKMSFSSL